MCKRCRHALDRRRDRRPYRLFQSRAKEANKRAKTYGAPGRIYGDDLRQQLEAQRGRCYWCDGFIGRGWHVDHVHDLARSLDNTPENVVCSCAACNTAKGGRSVVRWVSNLAARGIVHKLAGPCGVEAVAVPLNNFL